MAEEETRSHDSGSVGLISHFDGKVENPQFAENVFNGCGPTDPLRRPADSETIFRNRARTHVISAAIEVLIRVLGIGLLLCAFARAQCPVDTVIVKGRVENANAHSKVRVQLVYPKEKPGESGEVTVEDGAFTIPIEFVTEQSSIFSNLPKRCGRKPKAIVITLLENDQESDEIALAFPRDFRMVDASAYTMRSELVLHHPR